MSVKNRAMGGGDFAKNVMSRNLALLLCLGSFCAGMVFTNRYFFIFSIGFLLLSLKFQFLVTEVVALTELCIFAWWICVNL